MLPDKAEISVDESLNYPEEQRTKGGKLQDEKLPLLKEWLSNPFERSWLG